MPHHNPALTTPAAPPRQAWSLIRRVARSFALSLQVLPPVMRWPVALAYVLARASDTVADAPIAGHPGPASAQMRLQALQELRAAFQGARGTAQVQTTQSSLVALISELAPSSERTLLELVPAWLTALHQLPAKEQRLISEVCTTIIDGQQTDLQRFPAAQLDAEQVKALATTLEMDEYTWQVAGCVGRFWCLICEAHLPGWRTSDLEQMMSSGIVYGKSLQRLNILRDTATDLRQGRCYWPIEELSRVGLDAPRLAQAIAQRDLTALEPMVPLLRDWIREIRMGLSTGLAYCGQIPHWRLRTASALPALIGLLTLQALEKAGAVALMNPLKISRSQVRWILLRVMTRGCTRAGLARLGMRLGAQDLTLNKETA